MFISITPNSSMSIALNLNVMATFTYKATGIFLHYKLLYSIIYVFIQIICLQLSI
jgi:hypothetical protein